MDHGHPGPNAQGNTVYNLHIPVQPAGSLSVDGADWRSVQDAKGRKKIQDRLAQRRRRDRIRNEQNNASQGSKSDESSDNSARTSTDRRQSAETINQVPAPFSNDLSQTNSSETMSTIDPFNSQFLIPDDFSAMQSEPMMWPMQDGNLPLDWPTSPTTGMPVEPSSQLMDMRDSSPTSAQAPQQSSRTGMESVQDLLSRSNPSSSSGSSTPTTTTARDAQEPFHYILSEVKKLGYSSFDAMAADYYGSNFEEGSELHFVQKSSRTRHLRSLLGTLAQQSRTWSEREAQGYKDEIAKAAEQMYVDEIRRAKKEVMGGRDALRANMSVLFEKTQGLFGESNIDKKTLQCVAPELWALLTELLNEAGMRGEGCGQVITAIIMLLSTA